MPSTPIASSHPASRAGGSEEQFKSLVPEKVYRDIGGGMEPGQRPGDAMRRTMLVATRRWRMQSYLSMLAAAEAFHETRHVSRCECTLAMRFPRSGWKNARRRA
jgi:hypothetical protein